jgi:RNA polymerase sigma factor (sigma-70 family)
MSEDELSDEFLIDAVVGKAMWGLERLHERYSRRLYLLAYRMTADHMVAEELVQDTFLAVWQSAGSYAPQAGRVQSWLFSIIYHRTVNYLHGKRRRYNLQQITLPQAEADEHFLSDVWEQVWRGMQNEELHICLLQLPTEQQAAIELAYFEECTHSEIAQRYHIPLGTVKARIRLGILHLRQLLEQRGRDEQFLVSSTTRRQTRSSQAETVVVQVMEGGCAAGYELCRDGVWSCFRYSEWEHLVEQIETFEFRGDAGSFTAQKEERAHIYWYAYTNGGRWGSAGRQKTYLGRPAELTLARLEAMARKLHEEEPANVHISR